MASYQRRTDDLLRLKTRQLILQNVNGTYPGAGSMLYIADSNGTLGNASSITADASGNLSAITLGLQNPETFYRIPTVDPNTVTLPVLANSTNVLINSYNSLLTYLYDRNLINLENADISGESYGSLFATSNVPAGTTLITSSDYGLTWTTVAHNLLLTKIKRFFWNEAVKLWFAVGSNGIQTSGDGISWNPIITGLPNFPFQDIDANNDVMFTGLLGQPGQEQHLWFSYNNGTTWTKTAHATLSVNSIYWDGVRSFMFCLTDGNNRGRVFQSFSNDPKNWYPRGYITTWNSVNDIVDDGYTYVICGEPILGTGSGRKSLSYSYGDNNSWGWIDCSGDLFAESTNDYGCAGLSLAYNGSIFVCGGYDEAARWSIITSEDGITWTHVDPAATFTKYCTKVSWIVDKFIALGQDTGAATMKPIYSYDGITWTKTTSAGLPCDNFSALPTVTSFGLSRNARPSA